MPAILIAFSGRSGAGKTTVARALARELDAVHVRIDSIEQAIRESSVGIESRDDAGYRAGYALAEDNLRLGRIVVADSVNPWPETRNAWRAVAERAGARLLEVEVVCSNTEEHRNRVETRHADILGLRLPSWPEVVSRDYRPWDRERLVIDTAEQSADDSARIARSAVVARLWSSERKAILITGSMGAGKTTVLAEASDLLAARGVVHAAIDVDWFATGFLPAESAEQLLRRNLRATCRHYLDEGVRAFVLAGAVETPAELERLAAAIEHPQLVVCRLKAPLAIMQDRVRTREPGLLQQKYVDRSAELEAILDRAAVEHFAIANHDRSVTDVASELLAHAGWI